MKNHSSRLPRPPPGRPMFPIVGIGTPAGGLEALELSLRHVPAESGMTSAVIQHPPPTHIGNLPEHLRRSTPIKISRIACTTKAQPAHSYVILPNKDISVHKPDSITNYARLLQKNSHEVDLLFKELKSEGLL